MPMTGVMNAIAHASPSPLRGPKLDNRRVLAGVVDLAIVAFGAAVVLFAGDALSANEIKGALAVVILGWALYYFFALESGGGQTVGKKLMKLRVVREDGSPAGIREIAVRTILRVIDNYLVGLIVMLATGERRQRIGDLAAGTVIVDASGAAPAAVAPAAEVAVADEVEHDPVEEAPDVEAYAPNEPVDGEPIEEQPVDEEPVEDDAPAATATITLPSRPEPPETLADITAEQAGEDTFPEITSPSIEELARDVQATQAEPVEIEVEPQPVAFEPVETFVHEPVPVEPVEVPEVEPVAVEPDVAGDESVNVKSVETVSAIDLIMGGAAEQQSSEESDEDRGPAPA
jgi:uncharacterized RDD family membrane protein YckC